MSWQLLQPTSATAPVPLRLKDLDAQICSRFGGTQYEIVPVEVPHGAIWVRRVPLAEHSHHWSLPIDELRGRRVCTFPGCGHIADRAEMFQAFLEARRGERQ
jgi:hypothetical protein